MTVPVPGYERTSEEFVQPRLVKPDNRLAIDHNDRRSHEAQVFQFRQRILILRNIVLGECNSFF